jgi:hypothetical protein
MSQIIAIDPGTKGGIAWSDELETDCVKIPETLGDLLTVLTDLKSNGYATCYLEQVVGYIPMASPANMFTFGQSFGQIQGVLCGLGYRVIEVRPAKWQKELATGKKAQFAGDTAWKNHLKGIAQRLFPTCKVTLSTADALLILEYGMKQRN